MSLEIRKIGVIGAGQMGKGIAHVCALAGVDVALNDVTAERISAGITILQRNCKIRRPAERSTPPPATPRSRDCPPPPRCRIFATPTWSSKPPPKRGDQAQDPVDIALVLKPDAIIGTNTSSISITRLAAISGRPERFIGIHFMNPVPKMQLVELIRGIATDDRTFEEARVFITKLGKTITVSEDFSGLYRQPHPAADDQRGDLHALRGRRIGGAIDTAMKLGANHPMGPLQLADFIGLDVCLSVMQVLHEGLADSKYRPCPLLVKYVEAGWLGRKTQRGFYDYRSGAPVPTR